MHHEGTHQKGRNDIGKSPPGHHDDERGNNGSEEAVEVGKNVLVGTFDIEA